MQWYSLLVLFVCATTQGCANPAQVPEQSGGTHSTGGASQTGTGGTSTSGGAKGVGGSSSAGGAAADGGTAGVGGAPATLPPTVDGACACSSSEVCAAKLMTQAGQSPKTVHRCVAVPDGCVSCNCLLVDPCWEPEQCEGGVAPGGQLTCNYDVMP